MARKRLTEFLIAKAQSQMAAEQRAKEESEKSSEDMAEYQRTGGNSGDVAAPTTNAGGSGSGTPPVKPPVTTVPEPEPAPRHVVITPEDIVAQSNARKAAEKVEPKIQGIVHAAVANSGTEGTFGPAERALAKASAGGKTLPGPADLLGYLHAAHKELASFMRDPKPAASAQANILRTAAAKIAKLNPTHATIPELHAAADAVERHAANHDPNIFSGKSQGGYSGAANQLENLRAKIAHAQSLLTPGPVRSADGSSMQPVVAPGHQLASAIDDALTSLAHLHQQVSNSPLVKAGEGSGVPGWLGGVRIPVSRHAIETAKEHARNIAAEGAGPSGQAPAKVPLGGSVVKVLTRLTHKLVGAAPRTVGIIKTDRADNPNKNEVYKVTEDEAPDVYQINPAELPESDRAYVDSANNHSHPETKAFYRAGDKGPDGQVVTPSTTHYLRTAILNKAGEEIPETRVVTRGRATAPTAMTPIKPGENTGRISTEDVKDDFYETAKKHDIDGLSKRYDAEKAAGGTNA